MRRGGHHDQVGTHPAYRAGEPASLPARRRAHHQYHLRRDRPCARTRRPGGTARLRSLLGQGTPGPDRPQPAHRRPGEGVGQAGAVLQDRQGTARATEPRIRNQLGGAVPRARSATGEEDRFVAHRPAGRRRGGRPGGGQPAFRAVLARPVLRRRAAARIRRAALRAAAGGSLCRHARRRHRLVAEPGTVAQGGALGAGGECPPQVRARPGAARGRAPVRPASRFGPPGSFGHLQGDDRSGMITIDANDMNRTAGYPDLVDSIEAAFRGDFEVPLRHHHPIARPGQPDATLLLMPAWTRMTDAVDPASRYIGLKQVTIFPGNEAAGEPTILGVYILMSGTTGRPLAMIDAPELTVRRTASASALAARYLAREDASTLLCVGAGALAPCLVRAHASVRPIRDVMVWNRNGDKARARAETLRGEGMEAKAGDEPEAGGGP